MKVLSGLRSINIDYGKQFTMENTTFLNYNNTDSTTAKYVIWYWLFRKGNTNVIKLW